MLKVELHDSSFSFVKSCKSEGISKCAVPRPLVPHTFFHRINTFGVKIRPVLNKIVILIA